MSRKAHPEDDAPNAKFLHSENSPTAATVGSEVQYPASGEMVYRVRYQGGMGIGFADVIAVSGDSAADQVVATHPGCKVTHVEPAPQEKRAA